MIRVRICLLALVFLVFGCASETPENVDGQADDTLWHYVVNPTTGEIYGYTYAGGGTINLEMSATLGGPVVADSLYGHRIDARTILLWHAANRRNEGPAEPALFAVGPDGAAPIVLPDNIDNVDPDYTAAYHYPYAVYFANRPSAYTERMLVNVEARTAEHIPGTQTVFMALRISADGTSLRYPVYDSDTETWSLLNRDIATGTTRVVGELPGDATSLSAAPDRYGDRWVMIDSDDGWRSSRVRLMALDGTVTELLRTDPDEDPPRIGVVGNNLAIRPLNCDAECYVELRPLDGGESRFYPAPGSMMLTLSGLPGEQIIARSAGTRTEWLLAEDAEPIELGEWGLYLTESASRQLSPDRRWLVVWAEDGDTRAFRIWDLASRTMVAQQTYTGDTLPFHWAHTDSGFIAQMSTEDGGFDVFALRYSDSQVQTWHRTRSEDVEIYFELLPDGSALFARMDRLDEPQQYALYHYDPATGTESPLLSNVLPVSVQPLPPPR